MMCSLFRSRSGFTLVELMVSLVLTVIAVIAIYRSYVAIRVGVEIQEQQSEIHQNLRIGVQRMIRELRMAGFDPTGDAEAGFDDARDTTLTFTRDLDEDGDVTGSDVIANDPFSDESVTYMLIDTDGDGDLDLRRIDNNNPVVANRPETVVTNIDALRFIYISGSDVNPADGEMDLLSSKPLSAFERGKIRDVGIVMVVRATNLDSGYTNNRVYESNWDEGNPPANGINGGDIVFTALGDNFRRGQLVARVKSRNMGLN